MRRVGYPDVWPHSGSIEQILERYGLLPGDIVAAAVDAVDAKRERVGMGGLAASAM